MVLCKGKSELQYKCVPWFGIIFGEHTGIAVNDVRKEKNGQYGQYRYIMC